MPVIEYKSPRWNTHRAIALSEFDWPLWEQGCYDHFTVRRLFEGPRATYRLPLANQVDPVFDGSALVATATAADDIVDLGEDLGDNLLTGMRIAITAGTAGGVTTQDYYLIRLSATTVQLAETREDAADGTAVDITSDGDLTLTLPVAYLVRQSALSDASAGSVRYERTFATIPPQWFDPQPYSFIFPGLLAGAAGTADTITSIAAGGANEIVLSTALAGVAVNDTITAQVQYTRAGVVYNQSFYGKVLAASAGVSVTVRGNLLGAVGAPSSVSGSIREVVIGRTVPRSFTVDGRIQHDYALSSDTSLATDLPLFAEFQPTDNTGTETDALTATTSPTSTEYATLMTTGGEIVAECTRERYLGSIYVRKTTLIPAK